MESQLLLAKHLKSTAQGTVKIASMSSVFMKYFYSVVKLGSAF